MSCLGSIGYVMIRLVTMGERWRLGDGLRACRINEHITLTFSDKWFRGFETWLVEVWSSGLDGNRNQCVTRSILVFCSCLEQVTAQDMLCQPF